MDSNNIKLKYATKTEVEADKLGRKYDEKLEQETGKLNKQKTMCMKENFIRSLISFKPRKYNHYVDHRILKVFRKVIKNRKISIKN